MKLLSMTLLVTFWGFSYVAIKVMVSEMSPILAATSRVILSLMILTIFFVLGKKSFSVNPRLRVQVWLSGIILQGIPFSLLFWSERHVSAGLTAILAATQPLWTYMLTTTFLRQDGVFSIKNFFGLLMGFLGVAFIFIPESEISGMSRTIFGMLGVLCVAFFYGVGTVMNRYLFSKDRNLNLYGSIYQQHISSLVVLVIVTLIFEGRPNFLPLIENRSIFLALYYLRLCSTAIAWILYLYLIREVGTLTTSLVTYLVPIVTLLGDFFLFSHIPGLYALCGAMFILFGVMLTQINPKTVKIMLPVWSRRFLS